MEQNKILTIYKQPQGKPSEGINPVDIKSIDKELFESLKKLPIAYNTAETYHHRDNQGNWTQSALSCQYLGFIIQFQELERDKAIIEGSKKLAEVIKFLNNKKLIYKILAAPMEMDLSNTDYSKSKLKDNIIIKVYPYEKRCLCFTLYQPSSLELIGKNARIN